MARRPKLSPSSAPSHALRFVSAAWSSNFIFIQIEETSAPKHILIKDSSINIDAGLCRIGTDDPHRQQSCPGVFVSKFFSVGH
jgi:hypothetical protein